MEMDIIKLKHITKQYDDGFVALKDINLTIESGKFYSLLGPSGSGKSTILRIIAGFSQPSSGQVFFDGKDITDLDAAKRHINTVFQNYALFPHLNVFENVAFGLKIKKQPMDKIKPAVKEALHMVRLDGYANREISELSGGQQQRVAIARALVQQPKILLMDEPLSNLDARLRLKIREEIRNLVKKVGITTLFVTHDQEEALSIGDKIILFNNGVIQQDDMGQNFYLEPNNYFVANFVGNPVIDNFKVNVKDGKITGSDFEINVDDLDKSRFKRDLTDGEYTLSVRPENILPAKTGHVSAKIDDVELIGRERILKFTHDGVQARSLVDLETQIKRGDNVNLKMRLDRVFLFTKEGERVY